MVRDEAVERFRQSDLAEVPESHTPLGLFLDLLYCSCPQLFEYCLADFLILNQIVRIEPALKLICHICHVLKLLEDPPLLTLHKALLELSEFHDASYAELDLQHGPLLEFALFSDLDPAGHLADVNESLEDSDDVLLPPPID